MKGPKIGLRLFQDELADGFVGLMRCDRRRAVSSHSAYATQLHNMQRSWEWPACILRGAVCMGPVTAANLQKILPDWVNLFSWPTVSLPTTMLSIGVGILCWSWCHIWFWYLIYSCWYDTFLCSASMILLCKVFSASMILFCAVCLVSVESVEHEARFGHKAPDRYG